MKVKMKMIRRSMVRKATAVALAAAMVIASTSVSADAAKKVTLTPKKVSIKVGKSEKLTLKNNTKKVTWTIASGKKYVSLKNKKKKSVTVMGKKAGKAKVQAKVGKKKYTCTVTVKPKSKKKEEPTSTPDNTSSNSTEQPTSVPEVTTSPADNPTQSPDVTIAPTNEPENTAAPTATPTAAPTQAPEETAAPSESGGTATEEPTESPADTGGSSSGPDSSGDEGEDDGMCTLSGQITDAAGNPTEYMDVCFKGTNGEESWYLNDIPTNKNGEYSIDLPYGEWTWVTSADGESEPFTLDSKTCTKNFQSKGFFVTGTVKNNGKNFYSDVYAYIEKEDGSVDKWYTAYSWYSEGIKYKFLLMPGTYLIGTAGYGSKLIKGGNVQEITITGSQTLDINVSLYKVSGTLFRHGNTTVEEGKEFSVFRIKDYSKSEVMWSDEQGKYSIYLPGNTTYEVLDYFGNVIKELNLSTSDVENYDIILDYYSIAGSVKTESGEPIAYRYLTFRRGNDEDKDFAEHSCVTSRDGEYTIGLSKGTWHVFDDDTGNEVAVVEVTDDNDSQNIVLTES